MSQQEIEVALEKVWAVFDTILEPKLNWNLKDLNLLKGIEVADDGGLDIRINVVETDPDKLTDFRLQIEEKLARFRFSPVRLVLRRIDVDIEGTSGVKELYGQIWKGWGREVHGGGRSRGCTETCGLYRRNDGCRYLWPACK